MKTIQSTTLYYGEGSSDKEYIVTLQQTDSGNYHVVCYYGPRGRTTNEAYKTQSETTLQKAESIYSKTVNAKASKGYKVTSEDSQGVISPVKQDKQMLGLLPQLLNAIDQIDVSACINNDAYFAQEKMDGQRIIIYKKNNEVTASNKLGKYVPIPTKIVDDICNIPHNFVLDGELVNDNYHAFDLINLAVDGKEICNENTVAYARYEWLNAYFNQVNGLTVVKAAKTTQEKLALYQRIMDEGGEGVVFKINQSTYTAGRPNKGGNQLKYKFVETCSCIVIAHHVSKRSVELGLYDEQKQLKSVGFVTIPPNKKVPAQDAVVEIRYLYAVEALVQPVYIYERNDIAHDECDMTQLKFKQGLKAAA